MLTVWEAGHARLRLPDPRRQRRGLCEAFPAWAPRAVWGAGRDAPPDSLLRTGSDGPAPWRRRYRAGSLSGSVPAVADQSSGQMLVILAWVPGRRAADLPGRRAGA